MFDYFLLGFLILIVLLLLLALLSVRFIPTDEFGASTILETWRFSVKRFAVNAPPFIRTEMVSRKVTEIDVEPVTFRLHDGVMITLDFFLEVEVVDPVKALFETDDPFGIVGKQARSITNEQYSLRESTEKLGVGSDANEGLLALVRQAAEEYGVHVRKFAVVNEQFTERLQDALAQQAVAELDLAANLTRLEALPTEAKLILEGLAGEGGTLDDIPPAIRVLVQAWIHNAHIGEH